MIALLLLTAVAVVPACIPRTLDLEDELAPTSAPASMVYGDYALTLDRAVRPTGIDYRTLLSDPGPLRRFLAVVASTGPRSAPRHFPRPADRIAYYLNAYNAAILAAVLEHSHAGAPPARFPAGPAMSIRLRSDGRWTMPFELADAAMRESNGDWRVGLALCGGRRGDPPLATRPYIPDLLEYQLNSQLAVALTSPTIVTIDHGWQKMRVGRSLYALRHRLVREYENRTGARGADLLNALLAVAPREQLDALNSAIGYDVVELAFDDHINSIE